MTIALLTILIAVTSVGLLWRTVRRLAQTGRLGDADALEAVHGLAPPETYRPLHRLFTAEDVAFVAKFTIPGGNALRRLRGARNRVIRLYLGQMQADFGSLWQLAREIAPHSADPDFAALMIRQFCSFHVLLTVARLRSLLGWRLPVSVPVNGLVSAMESLRTGVLRSAATRHTTRPRTTLTRA